MNSGQANHSDTGESEKFILSSAENLSESTASLPSRYGDNRLVAMARDPKTVFVYWEFTDETSERVRREGGSNIWEISVMVLRVETSADETFDIKVPRDVLSWYVRLGQPGLSCVIDLGLRRADGAFFSLLRSNRVQLPEGRVSALVDAQFASVHVTGDLVHPEEALALLERDANRVGQGSAEFSRAMAQRWEFLKSVFSGSMPSSMPSSGSSDRKPS